MYLSYSGYHKAVNCEFDYWNGYIGKTQKEDPDDRLGSIYGSSVGKLFEDFYTLKVWRQKDPKGFIMARVESTVDSIIKQETSPRYERPGGVLLWKGDAEGQNPKGMYATRDELLADVRDAVERGFKIIKHYRLLGPRADAEFKLDFITPEGHILGGRADFILVRTKPHNDLIIVDGKGSRHRDKYVDFKQLHWYGMLYWLHSVRKGSPQLPDRLAFLYWRHDPPDSMDWVDISSSDVVALYENVLETIRKIETQQKKIGSNATLSAVRGVFLPKANDQNCRFCPYGSICPPGLKVQENLKK